ncbi:MAG: hypothetical protein EOO20_09805 [Chryseobacterium sp.]|nr:MAG: hypothetical protein EOO20_09805 [Chryseobacterium sp.]
MDYAITLRIINIKTVAEHRLALIRYTIIFYASLTFMLELKSSHIIYINMLTISKKIRILKHYFEKREWMTILVTMNFPVSLPINTGQKKMLITAHSLPFSKVTPYILEGFRVRCLGVDNEVLKVILSEMPDIIFLHSGISKPKAVAICEALKTNNYTSRIPVAMIAVECVEQLRMISNGIFDNTSLYLKNQ